MKIFLGADHGGFEWKNKINEYLTRNGYDVEDVGARTIDPADDYPEFAKQVSMKVIGSDDDDPRGILLCRGGQGMAIAANRNPGVRASVIWSAHEAKMTRADNDSNVLCMPADHIPWEEVEGILETWLSTPFTQEERHIRRLQQIDDFYPN